MATPPVDTGSGALRLEMLPPPPVAPAAPAPMGLGSVAARAAPAAPMLQLGPAQGLGAAAAGGMPFDLGPAFASAPPPQSFDQRAKATRVQARGGLGAAAAAAVAPPPAASPSALQSALGEREGELGAIYDALANERFVTRTTANPLRPLVEQEARTFYGGDAAGPLQLEPFVPPPIEAGETEWEYMQRVAALEEEDIQRQFQEAETLGNVRDIGRGGHLGMGEAQLQAREGVGAAETEQAERVAQTMKEAAAMSQQATADARAADIERRDFARTQRDAIESVQAIQADAREKLQALPELDANRTFKSMDGGALFWSIIGNIAAGAMGSNQVNEALMARAQQDLDVQKANAAQAFDAAGAADAAVGQQMGLYRELLAAAGDEAAADAMFLQLQLDDASKMLEAQLAETTVPVLKAQLQESLVGLRQQIDQQEQAIQLRLATTPESFTTTTGSLGPRRRRLLEKRAEIKERERFELQKLGIASEESALERDFKREVEAGKANKKIDTKRAEQAYNFGKDVEKIETTIKGIEALTSKDDIPGYGFTASPIPQAFDSGQSDTNAQIDLVLDELARLKSGAAIGEDEWEMYDSMLRGGTTLGGEDRLRRNLDRVKTFLVNKRNAMEKGLDPDVRAYYRRNAGLADFEQEWTGGGDESVVEED